jgi:hypothetical protein
VVTAAENRVPPCANVLCADHGNDGPRIFVTIRHDNGKIEKLRLTDRAAADVGKNIGCGKVTLYFEKRDRR